MAEYRLHCMKESGNSYKAALMLQLAGCDWQPVWVDYFNGATRQEDFRQGMNEMGEVPILEHGDRKVTQSGAILTYLADRIGKFGGRNDDEKLEILRWMLFDNHKFTSYYATLRFLFGIAMGWSRLVGYWAHPVVRLIGPLPATAWLPIAFFAFSSSRGASTFLIALASFFPVTVLTWSGVSAVSKAYYDVARTMGASPWFLVRKVAVPAAMPSVFVGLFMGLGASFSVLVVAEMMGVKAGLGWYMQWAQGWAAYANMYAALLVMAVMCSSAVSLLFRVRDRLLSWQKGLVRW